MANAGRMTRPEVMKLLLDAMRDLAAARDELNLIQARMSEVRGTIEHHGKRIQELYRILKDS